MSPIAWEQGLSVGVRELDQQHQKLIEMLNELESAMRAGKGKESMVGTLTTLAGYTKTHFALEEKYFAQYDYPDVGKHISEHQAFIRKVKDFIDNYNADKVGLTMDIHSFLRNWVANHIMQEDKKYGAHFNKHGLT
jgi:hemerythrin